MILPSDIKIYYSGGASNSDPALSIGGEFSSVQVPSALENIFPTLKDSDVGFDISEYRCIYVFNTNATDNVFDLKTIFATQLNTPAQLYLGFNISDDVQKITITGQPNSGNVELTYTDFLGTDYDTNPIEFGENLNTFAQNIQNELNLLSPVFGNIVCTSFDSPTYQYIEISFTGLDGNRIHNLLTVKTNNLVGSSTVVLNLQKIVAGSPINTEAELLVNSEQQPTDIDFLSGTGFMTLLSLRAQEGFPIWIKRTTTSSTVPAVLAGAELQFTMIRTQFPSTPKPTVPPTPTPNPTASPCPTATPNVLFMKGANNFGQIGNNTTSYATDYTQPVGNAVAYTKICASTNSTFGIKTDGTLWAWGDNSRGELGDNTTVKKSSPVQTVSFGTSWSSVSSRTIHASAIKTDGTLWNWGSDNFGELGTNTNISGTSSPVQTCAFGTNWSKVATGNSFVGATKTDGTLWLWGHNIYGQLGNNSTTALGFGVSSPVQTCTFSTDWSSIACGFDHSAAIKKDGTLWCWGRNSFGQLGCNDTTDKSSPIQTVAYGTSWQKVFCGNTFTLGIKNDGTLWSWGYNYTGSLGDNTSINKSSPVQVYGYANNWTEVSASSNTLALNSNGEIWEFGSYGRSSPVQIYSCGYAWNQITNGGSFYGAISAVLPTPTPTLTPTPTPTPSTTAATPTPTLSASPTPTPTITPTPTSTAATPSPTASPTPTPSPTPSPGPTSTPNPTPSPTLFGGLGVLYIAWE